MIRALRVDPTAIDSAERTLNDALRSGHWQAVVAALTYIRDFEDVA